MKPQEEQKAEVQETDVKKESMAQKCIDTTYKTLVVILTIPCVVFVLLTIILIPEMLSFFGNSLFTWGMIVLFVIYALDGIGSLYRMWNEK
jgi:lipopolysaccharide/colanic/teichoic acid biosynthesis glycosyltransferase